MAEAKNFHDDVYYDDEELVKELSKLKIYSGLTSFQTILREQQKRSVEAQPLYGEASNGKQSEDKDHGTLNFFLFEQPSQFCHFLIRI